MRPRRFSCSEAVERILAMVDEISARHDIAIGMRARNGDMSYVGEARAYEAAERIVRAKLDELEEVASGAPRVIVADRVIDGIIFRRCRQCGDWQVLSMFGASKSTKHRRGYECKACRSKRRGHRPLGRDWARGMPAPVRRAGVKRISTGQPGDQS